MPAARQIGVNVPEGLEGSSWILTHACENTIQSPLLNLGDNLTGVEGRIKAGYIREDSGHETGSLKSHLENLHAEPEPTALTGVVPDIVLIPPSFLFVHVND